MPWEGKISLSVSSIFWFALGVVVFASLIGPAQAQSRPSGQSVGKGRSWEHRFLPCGSSDGFGGSSLDASKINEHGKVGWELVPLAGYTPSTQGNCLFRK